jgi:hypothetical protein
MFGMASTGRFVLTAAVAAWALSVPMSAAADESTAGPDFSRDLSVEQLQVFEVEAPDATGEAGAEALVVTAWVDHDDNTFTVGDTVRLYVESNQDAFLTVINVGSSGSTTVLFPKEIQTDNRIVAGEVLEIAGPDEGLRIGVGAPAGTELITVIASNYSDEVFEPAELVMAGPFRSLEGGAVVAVRRLEEAMANDPDGKWSKYDHVLQTLELAPTPD